MMPELVFGAVGLITFLGALLLARPREAEPSDANRPVPRADGLRAVLSSTRSSFWSRLRSAWGAGKSVDARLSGLEEALLAADVGVKASERLLQSVRAKVSNSEDISALREALRSEMIQLVSVPQPQREFARPHVIVVVGVNGVGKTTTIAKLAHHHIGLGRRVILVAADTFRAAAVEQLALWAERLQIECIKQAGGTDPSAVAYDGMRAGLARGADVIIVDTAGRLHVKANLMAELQKVARIINREIPDAPHEVLLVIDATTGQNAIIQAKTFKEAIPLTGIILTKLDGSAKGGAALSIPTELELPILYVGFGEKPTDFAPFEPTAFVDAMLPNSVEASS